MKLLQSGIPLLFLVCLSAFGQDKNDSSLYNYFDKAVGIKNLGINNGPIHLDPYRSFDQSHRYYITNKYFPGDVIYDSQPYTNQNLKYDAFKDILVAKVNEPNNSLGINLIQEKTLWFTFNNKKFVNLNYDQKHPQFGKGYYEEYASNSPMKLYIKYHKDQIEVLTNDGLFYKYQNTTEFVINYGGNYTKISDARDLEKMFPNHQKEISDFAYVNRDTEKTDKAQFMKIMIDYVNNSLIKDTK